MISFSMAAQSQGSPQTRDQIQAQVRDQIREAQQQIREAEQQIRSARNQAQTTVRVERVGVPQATPAPMAPLPPLPPMGGSGRGGEGVIVVPSGGFGSAADIPPRAQEVVMMFFATMAIIVIGLPIARALSRWIDRRANAPAIRTADVEPHLVRIEQAVEAMAIEIERVSEAQRYLTKLQTGAHADPLLVPRHQGD